MQNTLLLTLVFLLFLFSATFDISHAKPQTFSPSISQFLLLHQSPNSTHPWPKLSPSDIKPLVAGILSFLAAAISSAGGIGGGGLFIPILIIVGGLDLKTASSYSAFMVTGGSIASVGCHVLGTARPLIDYDIALLSEPCMLLGVSCGVIWNLVLPEWLITMIFAVFLAFCTFKTCKSGILFWVMESEIRVRREIDKEERKQALLRNKDDDGERGNSGIPWLKLGVLLLIWFSFFLLYLLRGSSNGQGIIDIEACGTVYWILSSIQIPLALIFTVWILRFTNIVKDSAATQEENGAVAIATRCPPSSKLFFPVMALLAGVLGGMFGIGGGMLISPLLLQIGTHPQNLSST